MEYDFFNFLNHASPVWVRTIRREHHQQDAVNNDTIISTEYSDGFGRLLQTRSQAERVIFGDQVLGSSGIGAAPDVPNANAVGVENTHATNINVTVSGWQVYDNKGRVVEKYEPFFDKGFGYVPVIAAPVGQRIRMFYDPRGQLIRTINPDGSEQRVVLGIPLALNTPQFFTPSPWESYTYDAADLDSMSPHFATPKSAVLDALGRVVRTMDRLQSNNSSSTNVQMLYSYDVRGNLLEVRDAYNRVVFSYTYDFANRPLRTVHVDAGSSTALIDAAGRPVETRDAKGALSLQAYDVLSRPIRLWARDRTAEAMTLRQHLIYGDENPAELANPSATNHRGKLFRHFDEAGLLQINEYDFKGNVLLKTRRVISDAELLGIFGGSPWQVQDYRVDWEGLNINLLASEEHTTDQGYDALNRVKYMALPQEYVNGNRFELFPTYNKAGALERVMLSKRIGDDPEPYVDRIAYNARGQRILLAMCDPLEGTSGIMTRYRYDALTFRLQRVRSETYTRTTHLFQPDGSVRQDKIFSYDKVGNITALHEELTDCGYGSSPDELSRSYSYDALYRLLSATGRETDRIGANHWDDSYRSEDMTLARGYTQQYDYDLMGNLQQLRHTATGSNFNRNLNYLAGSNILGTMEAGGSEFGFTHDACGNMTSDAEERHYQYDHSNRLRSFRVQIAEAEPSKYALYLYDAAGSRVKKLVRMQGGSYVSTTYIDGVYEYLYYDDPNSIMLFERHQNHIYIMDTMDRLGDIRLGNIYNDTTPELKYILSDHLGSSTVLVEPNGALINKEEYYPFGETSFGSYGLKRYRFTGKERDNESGLYYYGARYYAAWLCRFISVDPLAAKSTDRNPYHYASNNPINRVDPSGMKDEPSGNGGGDKNNGGGKLKLINAHQVDAEKAKKNLEDAEKDKAKVMAELANPSAGSDIDKLKDNLKKAENFIEKFKNVISKYEKVQQAIDEFNKKYDPEKMVAVHASEKSNLKMKKDEKLDIIGEMNNVGDANNNGNTIEVTISYSENRSKNSASNNALYPDIDEVNKVTKFKVSIRQQMTQETIGDVALSNELGDVYYATSSRFSESYKSEIKEVNRGAENYMIGTLDQRRQRYINENYDKFYSTRVSGKIEEIYRRLK